MALLDPQSTKLVEIALALATYGVAMAHRQVTPLQVALCCAFLMVGIPLGYDTLMYTWLIESGGLYNYGPLWSALGQVAEFTRAWWVVYLLCYAIVIRSFVLLSRDSGWPSLLLAVMTTLPGLGFDFLSLLRQGLSTAFVIFFHLQMRQKRYAWATQHAAMAYLAHPAGLIAVLVLTLVHFRSQPRRLAAALTVGVLAVWMVYITFPAFFDAQVRNAAFLLLRYIVSDDTIENESGGKLLIFWTVLVCGPIALAVLRRRLPLLSSQVLAAACFMATYGLLLSISGSSVRLTWFLLPMMMATVTTALRGDGRRPAGLLTRTTFVGLCFAASAYVLSIAPEHFWDDEYPHEIHLAK